MSTQTAIINAARNNNWDVVVDTESNIGTVQCTRGAQRIHVELSPRGAIRFADVYRLTDTGTIAAITGGVGLACAGKRATVLGWLAAK